jgi:hypothetical protein
MEYNLTPPNSATNAVNNIASVRLSLDNTNPAILPQLAKGGAVLNGVVQNRTREGMVLLQTDFGSINLKSELFLKRGAELVIKIEQKQAELIAKIISINGLSPNKYQEMIDGEATTLTQDKVTTSSNIIAKQVNSNQPAPAPAQSNQVLLNPNISSPTLRGVFVQQPKIAPELLQQIAPNITESPNIGTALQLKIINILLPEDNVNDELATLYNLVNDEMIPHNDINQPIPAKQNAGLPNFNLSNNNELLAPEEAQLPSPATTNAANASPKAIPKTLNYHKNMLVITPSSDNHLEPASLTKSPIINSAPPNPAQFNGVVLHQANMRELTMQTEMGMVKLFLTTPIPKGAVIQFELLQLEQVRGGNALPELSPEELLQQKAIPATLPALEEIVELKHIGSIPTPLPLQPHIVPRFGANLAAEVLFFLNAITGGTHAGINPAINKPHHDILQNWLGDELMQQITANDEGGKKTSILNNELNMLKQSFANAPAEQWQSALIPLYDGQQVRPIQFFMKKKQSANKGITQTTNHFMLELELSNIGVMQLDCLVQQQNNQHGQNFTKFDMIIRKQNAWEDSMKSDIINIFTNVQQISGLKGAVQFKHGKDAIAPHPEIITKSASPSFDNSLIV